MNPIDKSFVNKHLIVEDKAINHQLRYLETNIISKEMESKEKEIGLKTQINELEKKCNVKLINTQKLSDDIVELSQELEIEKRKKDSGKKIKVYENKLEEIINEKNEIASMH